MRIKLHDAVAQDGKGCNRHPIDGDLWMTLDVKAVDRDTIYIRPMVCQRTQPQDHEWDAVAQLVPEYVGLSEYDFECQRDIIRELGVG